MRNLKETLDELKRDNKQLNERLFEMAKDKSQKNEEGNRKVEQFEQEIRKN